MINFVTLRRCYFATQKMKNLFLIPFLFFAMTIYGQKEFKFDYMLKYDYQNTDTSKVKTVYILTNSKDNSYKLELSPSDSLKFDLYFRHEDIATATGAITEKELLESQYFTFDCENIMRYSNPFKDKVENYDFSLKQDTVIGQEKLAYYILKSNKPKKEKRKKLGTLHYMVAENTSFHLPLLRHPTAYEEWKSNPNIPNGIPKVMYFTAYGKTNREMIYTLREILKIDKTASIPSGCDYVNNLKIGQIIIETH